MSGGTIFDLSGKTALVVGGGGGIGGSGAIALSEHGADIFIADLNGDAAQAAAREIETAGGKAEATRVDLTRPEDVQRMVSSVLDTFGRIDILLNCAGISIRGPAVDFALDEWNRVLAVNLTGMFIVAQAVGKEMIRRQSGKIIHISSLSAHLAHPGNLAYAAAKHGLTGMSKVMAVEWAQYNVNVNCIAPGVIRTPLTEAAFQDENQRDIMTAKVPMGRIGRTDDLIGTIVFLASNASDFITGQTIYVDGGRMLD